MKIIIFSLFFFYFQIVHAQTLTKDSVNTKKLLLVSGISAGTFVYAYGIQNNMWWKGKPAKFHTNWQQDWTYALGSDKIGHFFFGNLVSTIYKNSFKWIGFSSKHSYLYAGLFTFAYQTFLEIRDGFSKQYGFSWGDFAANSLGSMYLYMQYNYPPLKNFNLKISYFPSARFRNGSNAYITDDYESTYHWLSINIKKLLPNKWGKYFPNFINIALGHGVKGLDNLKFGKHEIFVAVDWNLQAIKTKSKLLKSLLEILNKYHFPSPAIKIYPNIIWYGLKF